MPGGGGTRVRAIGRELGRWREAEGKLKALVSTKMTDWAVLFANEVLKGKVVEHS